MAMTGFELRRILSRVTFRDWRWRVMDKGDGFLIQVAFDADDCDTGCKAEQRGRKWYVSAHACLTEVVQTAYAAVERAVIHEVKEDFKYRGRRIYDPHGHVESLVAAVDHGEKDKRS